MTTIKILTVLGSRDDAYEALASAGFILTSADTVIVKHDAAGIALSQAFRELWRLSAIHLIAGFSVDAMDIHPAA